MAEAPSSAALAVVPDDKPDGTLAAATPPSGGGAARSGIKRQGVLGFLSGNKQGSGADNEGHVNGRSSVTSH